MVYITTPLMPVYHQMTIEELLYNLDYKPVIRRNKGSTRTYVTEGIPWNLRDKLDIPQKIAILRAFNERWAYLRETPNRADLYEVWYIPKKTRGFRKICAPKPDLMTALRQLKMIFEDDFRVLYHTSAFAYVKGRSAVEAVKKHQQNESRWFGHFDLHDFFGSTTKEFVLTQFSKIFPFSEIMRSNSGLDELAKALDLAFLDGGLPQGTPISPLITNVMMIPFDFRVTKRLRDLDGKTFIYTRYADDIHVSCRFDFDINRVQEVLMEEMRNQNAPFVFNTEKTHYGSCAGRNWMLGVMLNKDNKITIGHKKKKNFISMLRNFILSSQSDSPWTVEEVQCALGLYSYYRSVEEKEIDDVVGKVNAKFSCDVIAMMRKVIA